MSEKQFKNMFTYLLPAIVGNILPLCTLPILTRILSPEDYGLIALAQVYSTIVVSFCCFGLPLVSERNFFKFTEEQDKGQLFWSIITYVIFMLIVAAIVTFFYKDDLFTFFVGTQGDGLIFFISLVANAVLSINSFFYIFLKNSEDSKKFATYKILESVGYVIFSLFLVVLLRTGIIGIIWSQLLIYTIVLILMSLKFLKRFHFKFSMPLLIDSLKLAAPLLLRNIVGVVNSQFDKYFIGLMKLTGSVGIYSLGQKMAYIIVTYMNALDNVFSPQLYKKMFAKEEHFRQDIGIYLCKFLYLSIFITLMCSLFSEEVIYILMPEPYFHAIDIIMVLSMGFGFIFFGKTRQLHVAGKTNIISILSVFSLIFIVSFNIFFISRWGAIGAAWAMFASSLTTNLISFVVAQRYYKIEWKYGMIISVYFILIFFTVAILILRMNNFPYLWRLSIKLLALSLYFILGIKAGIISKHNYRVVKKILLPNIPT